MTSASRMLRALPLYEWYRRWRVRRNAAGELLRWERAGRPAPPPHLVKQGTLRECATAYGLTTMVETGTYYGDMIAALTGDFARLISIELQPSLARRAQRRFARESKVQIVCGDSGDELGTIVRQLREPALFWLDGHYSGGETARGVEDTPVMRELGHILRVPEGAHVVLIDDARLFGSDPAYPTLDALKAAVLELAPAASVTVADDIVRIVPAAYSDRNRSQA